MKSRSASFSFMRPDILLQAEGLFALLVSCWCVHHFYPHHWGTFALLFLIPDLSMLGYAVRWKHAAALYNLAHSYVLPLSLGLVACVEAQHEAGLLSLTWLSHISFDRLLGYGLKFPGLFKYTQIQRSRSATGVPVHAA